MTPESVRLAAPLAIVAALALAVAGCSKSQTAQARSAETAPKSVKIAVVHKEAIRRAIDVVGTLAAVDQVTISSEADGKVRGILADLGDRVKAGQVLIQLDSEKQQYTYEQQQAALARTLAQYGAPDPKNLPDGREDPDVQKAKADLVQATQSFDRASELFKRDAHLAAVARRCEDGARVEAGQLRRGAAEREEPARRHPSLRGQR